MANFTSKCARCGSYAINPHIHGRELDVDLDLCDVCYWRKRAEKEDSERVYLGDITVVLDSTLKPGTIELRKEKK